MELFSIRIQRTFQLVSTYTVRKTGSGVYLQNGRCRYYTKKGGLVNVPVI